MPDDPTALLANLESALLAEFPRATPFTNIHPDDPLNWGQHRPVGTTSSGALDAHSLGAAPPDLAYIRAPTRADSRGPDDTQLLSPGSKASLGPDNTQVLSLEPKGSQMLSLRSQAERGADRRTTEEVQSPAPPTSGSPASTGPREAGSASGAATADVQPPERPSVCSLARVCSPGSTEAVQQALPSVSGSRPSAGACETDGVNEASADAMQQQNALDAGYPAGAGTCGAITEVAQQPDTLTQDSTVSVGVSVIEGASGTPAEEAQQPNTLIPGSKANAGISSSVRRATAEEAQQPDTLCPSPPASAGAGVIDIASRAATTEEAQEAGSHSSGSQAVAGTAAVTTVGAQQPNPFRPDPQASARDGEAGGASGAIQMETQQRDPPMSEASAEDVQQPGPLSGGSQASAGAYRVAAGDALLTADGLGPAFQTRSQASATALVAAAGNAQLDASEHEPVYRSRSQASAGTNKAEESDVLGPVYQSGPSDKRAIPWERPRPLSCLPSAKHRELEGVSTLKLARALARPQRVRLARAQQPPPQPLCLRHRLEPLTALVPLLGAPSAGQAALTDCASDKCMLGYGEAVAPQSTYLGHIPAWGQGDMFAAARPMEMRTMVVSVNRET